MIDDTLTRSVYKDTLLQQRAEVMQVFPELLEILKPRRIIEIGTGHGGLTLFLQDQISNNTDIFSFEILSRPSHEKVISSGVNLYNENIFVDPPSSWKKYEVSPKWVPIFKQKSPLLVLVDGGNKIAEFNGIAPLLNSGDVIMLHDYATNKQVFENLRVWKWMEAEYSQIEEACVQNNLVPYMERETLKVAWGCFIKK